MADRDLIRSAAVRFGSPPSLVGVVTTPADQAATKPVTVVFLNAGVIHHVGPNRLYVMLATRMAGAGFRSLRFDLSGIGDSEIRRDEHDLDGSVLRDIDDALTFMSGRYGDDRFVLAGICTGANNGLRFAHRDERIVGVIPIDPFAYKTLGFYARHYGRRALRWESWVNAATGRNRYFRKLVKTLSGVPDEKDAFAGIGGTVAPPPRVEKPEMRHMLQNLVDRQVPVLQIFTGGNIRYNHRDQFWTAFPGLTRGGALSVEFMEEAGHTFARHRHRQDLAALLEEWLRSNLAEAPARPPSLHEPTTETARPRTSQ